MLVKVSDLYFGSTQLQLKTQIITLLAFVILSSCSTPNIYEERQKNLAIEENCIFPNVEAVHLLTYDEAVLIALRTNWKVRFQKTQAQIERELVTSETLHMLPALSASGEFSRRSNLLSILNTAPSVEQTTARLNFLGVFDLTQFGLAYFTSFQEKLKLQSLLIQQEKARHDLIIEVAAAYWKSAILSSLADEQRHAIILMNQRIEMIRSDIENKLTTRIDGLFKIDELLKKILEITPIEREYDTAKQELLLAMGIPPSTQLSFPEMEYSTLPNLHTFDIHYLETLALHYRPELFNLDQQQAISMEEVKIKILSMVPLMNFFMDHYWDKNKFLVSQQWSDVGIRASWDLLSLPSKYYALRSAKETVEFIKEQRLSASAAVISQVNLTYIEIDQIIAEYNVAKEKLLNLENEYHSQQRRVEAGADYRGKLPIIYGEYVLAKFIAATNYAKYHSSVEKLAVSIGLPMLFYPNTEECQNASF